MTEVVRSATLRNPAFWICLAITIGLFITGLCMPPHGEIDGSILTAASILFAFATLYEVHIAIKKGVNAKLRHSNTELSVGDLDDDDDNSQDENNDLN